MDEEGEGLSEAGLSASTWATNFTNCTNVTFGGVLKMRNVSDPAHKAVRFFSEVDRLTARCPPKRAVDLFVAR